MVLIVMNEEKVFKNAEKNLEFFNIHFNEFEMKYPNQFVAVSGANLIAVGETPDSILKEVNEKKIDKSNLLIEFIPLPSSILAL